MTQSRLAAILKQIIPSLRKSKTKETFKVKRLLKDFFVNSQKVARMALGISKYDNNLTSSLYEINGEKVDAQKTNPIDFLELALKNVEIGNEKFDFLMLKKGYDSLYDIPLQSIIESPYLDIYISTRYCLGIIVFHDYDNYHNNYLKQMRKKLEYKRVNFLKIQGFAYLLFLALSSLGYYFDILTDNEECVTFTNVMMTTGFVLESHFVVNEFNYHDYFSVYNCHSYVYTNYDVDFDPKAINPMIHVFRITGDYLNALDGPKDENRISYLETIRPDEIEEDDKIQKYQFYNVPLLLRNVAIYKRRDAISPAEILMVFSAEVDPKVFFSYDKDRIKISHDVFVDYNTLHDLRISDYLKSQHYLSKASDDDLKNVDEILKLLNINEREKEELRLATRKISVSIKKFLNCDVLNNENSVFEKVRALALLLGFPETMGQTKAVPIKLYSNQIISILQATKFLVMKEKLMKNGEKVSTGFVYQIDTGEGKTNIIRCIALLLHSIGKKVDIVTSNIKLAFRDHNEKDKFGNQEIYWIDKGANIGVLAHDNEFEAENKKKISKNKYEKYRNFDNSTGMNIEEASRLDITYSTLLNFEAFYLYLLENNPKYLKKHYKNRVLLIDEADTLLIDEITNGTIISKPVKSNQDEILKYIFMNRKMDDASLIKNLKLNFGLKFDINIAELKKECEVACEYQNGRHYIIKKMKTGRAKWNATKEEKKKLTPQVIPYDYLHKGTPEQNREFNGYIQQFIAIKENALHEKEVNYEKVEIKPFSMTYLYLSHPIFVKQYYGACGFTGTIGDADDIQLIKRHYKMEPKIQPRHSPFIRVDLPMILCKTEKEKMCCIYKEIMAYNTHECNRPVLVIFSDIRQILSFRKYMKNKMAEDVDWKPENIYVIKGINDKNEEEEADPKVVSGQKGAITLSSNFCGRGTDINPGGNILHVILAYFSPDERVIKQALGRTARNENMGSTRIICLIDEFDKAKEKLDNKSVKCEINKYQEINNLQQDYINTFIEEKPWLFDDELAIQSHKINNIVLNLRSIKINVSRKTAVEYEFPFGLDLDTYIDIQSQRILSLINIPNTKYSWKLIARYFRELVLESWSLFIDKAQKEPIEEFERSYRKFVKKIRKYLPSGKETNDKHADSLKYCFVNTALRVQEEYENSIMQCKTVFPPECNLNIESINNGTDPKRLVSIEIGLIPYAVNNETVARINGEHYQDPELNFIKYENEKKVTMFLSQSVDWCYDKVFSSLRNMFSKLGLSMYFKRTLAGCEFGVCLPEKFKHKKLQSNFCICDQEFSFVASIKVRSLTPIFIAMFAIFGSAVSHFVNKSAVSDFANQFNKKIQEDQIPPDYDKMVDSLKNAIQEKSKKLGKIAANIDAVKDLMQTGKFHASIGASYRENKIDKRFKFMKLGLLIILFLGSRLQSFIHNGAIKDESKLTAQAKEYNQESEEKKKNIQFTDN